MAIYKVKHLSSGRDPETFTLVRSPTKARAISFASKKYFTADVCSQDDLIKYVQTGGQIEDASDQPSGQAGE